MEGDSMADEILFLGTGAADWGLDVPDLPLRRFSSILMNGKLLVDPGPHVFHFLQSFDAPDLYRDVSHVLLTHSHPDHFSRDTLCRLTQSRPITFCADEAVKDMVADIPNLHFCTMPLWCPSQIGGYEVIPLAANHSTDVADELPRHYIIRTPSGKKIFYGCDGAWLCNRTWKALRGHCFDVMVLDGTIGAARGDSRIFEHNSQEMVHVMSAAFRRAGIVGNGTALCISHLARTLHGTQQEEEAFNAPDGITVAYDGLKLLF